MESKKEVEKKAISSNVYWCLSLFTVFTWKVKVWFLSHKDTKFPTLGTLDPNGYGEKNYRKIIPTQ